MAYANAIYPRRLSHTVTRTGVKVMVIHTGVMGIHMATVTHTVTVIPMATSTHMRVMMVMIQILTWYQFSLPATVVNSSSSISEEMGAEVKVKRR